jgi:large subunit ribosomal protein L4e
MAARPLVTVQETEGENSQIALPACFTAPIRPDLISTVHLNMNKNKRQAYAVSSKAGHQTSAESWGTGRAVSRIPRVPGGGTHRAGQGAFGNMCRGGRMFAPTHTWRRWHRKINLNQKRYAVVSALSAAALPSLVMARGHKIDSVPEVPLVIGDAAESLSKTSKALELLKKVGAYADCEKSAESKNLRRGKGKMRNRRYVMRRGPLVVYANDNGIAKAMRNIPGVDLCHVDRLNLLQLAPGGHMGRFIVWTKSACEKLDTIFGTRTTPSAVKKNFVLPRAPMANSDLNRLINSDEVQSIVNPPKDNGVRKTLKKNPLKNLGAMLKLNPYAKTAKRMGILAEAARKKAKAEKLEASRKGLSKGKGKDVKDVGAKFYKQMLVDSDYKGDHYDNFSTWLQA